MRAGVGPGVVLRGGALIGVLAVSVGALVMSVACSRPGAATESAPELTVWPVGTALHQPVWSYRRHALVAVTEDQRVAEVAEDRAAAATTRLSAPLAAGRNLQISTKDPAVVFVPQPARGRVAVVDLQSLRQVGDFDAGPAPAYLSEDAGLRMLLALSSDGRSVTPVDQYGYRKLATAPIGGAPAEVIDGANRGREIDYHVYAPSGIRHYQGPDSPAPQRGSLDIDVAVSAGDGTAVTRSYVAGHDDAVLYAVDSRRGGQGIEVLASTRLPAPIRALGTDDTRIYAATDRQLVTLETASFTGFPARHIPVLRTVDYRSALPESARRAPLSGMAVGPHRVYLTLAQAPFVVGIAKPRL